MERTVLTGAALAEEPIPIYRIDLSLPPRQRYERLATDFAPRMRAIIPLFDEILEFFIPWAYLRCVVKFLASMVLRRVQSSEQTQELTGIAKASGVEMYLLVALNGFLDSLLGCTSGVVQTLAQKRPDGRVRHTGHSAACPRMMHFRTLDWGMDKLRGILVVLEFVNSRSEDPDRVIGRSISYAGYVGALTVVK